MAKPHIIREANIIGRSPTSFAEGKHHLKNAPLSVDKSAFFVVLPLQNRSIQGYRTKTVRDFCREGTLIPWR